jgi:hypothetical protein
VQIIKGHRPQAGDLHSMSQKAIDSMLLQGHSLCAAAACSEFEAEVIGAAAAVKAMEIA